MVVVSVVSRPSSLPCLSPRRPRTWSNGTRSRFFADMAGLISQSELLAIGNWGRVEAARRYSTEAPSSVPFEIFAHYRVSGRCWMRYAPRPSTSA